MAAAKKAPNPIDRHVGSRVRMRRMMLAMSQEKLGDAGRWRELIPKQPPVGTAEQCADLVAFLASDRAGWMTGETIPIDGGRHLTCAR